MFLISFMGCCGAFRKIRFLLGAYSLTLILVFVAEISVFVFTTVYSAKLRDVLSPILKLSIKDQYMGDMANKSITSIAWDSIMFNVNQNA